ncbi:hypothetical protein E1B28_005991 [Marasmius oreades]|uniref:Ubiquitin-like protease family profile domain-containing protein n=1 Tax=Marasmius oreades TaxID=181124 RepID=A0A9P7S497_9AGAR|nr:uncharacterized protein E1B28_005991 [Marasmius oreades]KAG7095216.1 hypothetical protein E1B28_005991 [Marasmius oreades]
MKLRDAKYCVRNASVLDALVANEELDNLYLPLHINGNHWTLLELNLSDHTISYADSLTPSTARPPNDVVKILCWWLDGLGIRKPQPAVVAPAFSVARQQDSFSCGVIVLSTLAQILLGRAAWAPDYASDHRMEWFTCLAEHGHRLQTLEMDEDEEDMENPAGCGSWVLSFPRYCC